MPYYHIISEEEVPHIKHLHPYKNIKEFEKDIDFLLRNYSPISLSGILDSIKNNQFLPKNSFLLTFDDGLREMYSIVAPILKEKGTPATFFICSAFLDNQQLFYRHKASIIIEILRKSDKASLMDKINDIFLANKIQSNDLRTSILSIEYHQKHVLDEIASILDIDFNGYLVKYQPYLSSDQIKKLIKDGFTVGAHSIDHPLYSSLSLQDQLHQTRESVKLVRDKFSLDYGAFAFPFSDSRVSNRYFEEVSGSAYVDISFGTSGMVKDIYANVLQRFSMEGTPMPAERIVARQYAEKLARVMIGKYEIKRS